MFEYGPRRGHRERVLAEGSGEEGLIGLWVRVVAVAPHAAINGVHEFGLTRDDPDGHPAADHLTVGCYVGFNAEPRLRAAGVKSEARDHLVDDEPRPRLRRYPSQLMKELPRL